VQTTRRGWTDPESRGRRTQPRSSVRRRLRSGLLITIVALYAFSIPWYRGEPSELRLWLGLPDWVTTALFCYVAVAILNFGAWQLTEFPDPTPRLADDDRVES